MALALFKAGNRLLINVSSSATTVKVSTRVYNFASKACISKLCLELYLHVCLHNRITPVSLHLCLDNYAPTTVSPAVSLHLSFNCVATIATLNDIRSSIYLTRTLNLLAEFLCFDFANPSRNSDRHRNRSARRGSQLVTKGCLRFA